MTSLSVALHRDVAERLGLDMAGGADDGPVSFPVAQEFLHAFHVGIEWTGGTRFVRIDQVQLTPVQFRHPSRLACTVLRPSDLNLGLTVTESNTVDPNPETTAGRLTEEPLPAKDTDGAADHRTGEKQAQENQETESPV